MSCHLVPPKSQAPAEQITVSYTWQEGGEFVIDLLVLSNIDASAKYPALPVHTRKWNDVPSAKRPSSNEMIVVKRCCPSMTSKPSSCCSCNHIS